MKKLIFICILTLMASLALAVAIIHVPPQSFAFAKETQLVIEVQQDLADIAEMKLNYKIQSDTRWMFETAKQESPGSVYYKVTLPAKVLNVEPVEYYFSIELNHGTTEYFPAQDGVTPNYVIKPETMEGESSPGFVLLTDEPTISADDGYMLVVSYFAIADDVDPASIEVWVGGKNVTSEATITSPTIVYKEDRPQAGIKKAIIRAKVGTMMINSATWATEVLPGVRRAAMPFDLRGSVNFASNLYDYSDKIAPGYGDNDAATWADLYGRYGILDVQTHLLVSSLEKTNRQPVNRYTLGLQIPHLDVFLGDYSPSLSALSMSGRNLRGIYSSFYGRLASISFAHGQSVRKTTNETDVSNVAGIQKSGTFKQEALGARLQFGSDQDFMLGINVTRHRDVVSSLDSLYYQYQDASGQTVYSTPAKDNAVVSLDMKISIPEQHTVIGTEVAGSMLNNNTIPGAISQQEIEDYTGENVIIDPTEFSNLFVINKNMEPFIPSRANTAWLAYVRTYFWNNRISVQYAETGSAFNAYGTSYQMSDSKALTVSDQLNISKLLMLTGGLSYNEDNLMNHKSETNMNTSWFVQSILRVPRIPYLKAAYYANSSKNKDNPDVAVTGGFQKRETASNNLSFGIGYNISQIPIVPTQLDISYRMGGDEANNLDTLSVATPISENENNGLNITMFNRFTNIPLTTQFAMSQSTQEAILTPVKNETQSLMFGAAYGFWNKKINPYINYRSVSLNGDSGKSSYGYFTLGVEAMPLTDLQVNTSLGFQSHSNKTDSSLEYSNVIWRVLLTQRF